MLLPLEIKFFKGLQPYTDIFDQMKQVTLARHINNSDRLWFLEHSSVFTLGQAGKKEHLLAPGDIPVIQSDRGGQVTYHGPGQLMIYVLWDLKRLNLSIRGLVCQLETFVINLLEQYGIQGHRIDKAPGIYVAGKKIASLGLRVKKGCCYHGISLNVSMALEPFSRINPCGFKQLQMTQIRDYVGDISIAQVVGDMTHMIQKWYHQQQAD